MFSIARTAMSLNDPAEPQLNPNHPSQSSMHPMNIRGTLWDLPLITWSLLLPMATAAATPEIPEQMCTTVPPAKSWTGRPRSDRPALRNPPPQTMWAMGA